MITVTHILRAITLPKSVRRISSRHSGSLESGRSGVDIETGVAPLPIDERGGIHDRTPQAARFFARTIARTARRLEWIVGPAIALCALTMFASIADSQPVFEKLKGLQGGRVYRLDVDSRGILHASVLPAFSDGAWQDATREHGVFRTTDQGRSWVELGQMARQKTGDTDCTGYTVVRAPNGDLLCGSSCGVYISSDEGISWREAGLAYEIRSIAVDYSNRLIYAAGHVSSDNGASWYAFPAPIKAITYTVDTAECIICVTPTDMYKSCDTGRTWIAIRPSGAYDVRVSKKNEIAYAIGDVGVYMTDNIPDPQSGEYHWRHLGLRHEGVRSVAFDSANVLYAGGSTGVFQYTGQDTTWRRIRPRAYTAVFNTLAVDANHTLFAGANGDPNLGGLGGVHVSTDGGASWAYRGEGLLDVQISNLWTDEDGRLFAATKLGAFLFDETLNAWKEHGFDQVPVWSFERNRDGDLLVGAHNGLYRKSDDGETWTRLVPRGTILGVRRLGGDNLFCDFAARSTDGGRTWDAANIPQHGLTRDILFRPSDGVSFLASDLGVLISADSGKRWHTAQTPASSHCLALNDRNEVFVGTLSSGVYRYRDDWRLWTWVGVPRLEVYRLHNTRAGLLLAGTPAGGLWASTDEGDSWFALEGTEKYRLIKGIAKDTRGRIYIGTESGCYRSIGPLVSMARPPDENVFRLGPISPNPFRDRVSIAFELPYSSAAVFQIWNALGTVIREHRVESGLSPGFHSFLWDGNDEHGVPVPSGLYFSALVSSEARILKPLMLLR